MKLAVERQHPLADVLGEVADPLEVVGHAQRPTISRRSTAIGCRRAIVSTARSSISACSASMLGSLATVRWARSASRRASASTASAICFSASPPISATIPGELLEVDVEGLCGVFGHYHFTSSWLANRAI
jgi:hypothetical protein